MKSSARNKLLVGEMLDSIHAVLEYTPSSKQEFMKDIRTQDAILMRLHVIGELLKQQPDDMRERYADLPWREAIGLRNIIAHDYGDVDLDRIWELLQEDFPAFARRMEEIAAELGVE